MNIIDLQKESINYALEMHLNMMKHLGLAMVLDDEKPQIIIDALSSMDGVGRMMIHDSMKDYEFNQEYKNFVESQLTLIWKEALEVTKNWNAKYKGMSINEEWEKGV